MPVIARALKVSFEQVLWHLDSPQLILLRANDKSFVIAVSISAVSRKYEFFGAKISINQLDEYLRNRFDLRFILTNPDRKKHFLFNYPAGVSEIRLEAVELSADQLEKFLPDHGTFASDHSEEYHLFGSPYSDVQRYLVDGKWDVREFSKFHAQLSDLYALTRSVDTFEDESEDLAKRRQVVESFMKPWQGGGSYLAFFQSISSVGGRASRPQLEAIQWASPGYIDVLGNQSSFDKITSLLEHYDNNRLKIETLYSSLWKFLSEMKLLNLRRGRFDRKSDLGMEVNVRTKQFCNALNLAPYRTIKKMAGNDQLVAAKVLLAAARRLSKMHQFFLEGRVALEQVEIG